MWPQPQCASALAVNYCSLTGVTVDSGAVNTVELDVDGSHISLQTRCVVNAAGVWAERVDDLVNGELADPLPALTVRPARCACHHSLGVGANAGRDGAARTRR